jgi:hypothetical protein
VEWGGGGVLLAPMVVLSVSPYSVFSLVCSRIRASPQSTIHVPKIQLSVYYTHINVIIVRCLRVLQPSHTHTHIHSHTHHTLAQSCSGRA